MKKLKISKSIIFEINQVELLHIFMGLYTAKIAIRIGNWDASYYYILHF